MKSRNAVCAVSLMLIAAALAAPAAAGAAERWWFDHREGRFPTVEIPKEDEPNLSFVSLTDKKGTKYGPCSPLKVKGTLFNRFGGMGEGTVTGILESGFKDCPVSTTKPCKVVKFEPQTKVPWNLTLNTDNTVLITNFSLTVELAGECGEAELPNESTLTGAVEAGKTKFIPKSETAGPEIKFEKAQIGTSGVYLDGEILFGTSLTSLTEPSGFKAEQSPAKIDGSPTTGFVMTREGHAIECEEAALTGTAEDGDTTLELVPTYEKCKTEVGSVTITANDCAYLLHLEAEFVESEVFTYLAPTDVICEEGKEIEIEIFFSTDPEHKGNPFCKYGVSPAGNEGLETVELTNKGPEGSLSKGWIQAHVDVEGITSQLIEGSQLFCGLEVSTTGQMNGTYELTGTTEEGEAPLGIAVFPG